VAEEERVERRKLRFIREDPWIARTLREIRLTRLVPSDLRDWFWDWVEDVGTVMRSREMMVSFIASMGYYAISLGLISLLESLLGIRLGVVRRLLRI
jgi:hypothetical protein